MATSHKRIIRFWLYTGAFMVFAMVIIGGITRLTHSGLSMVEWKLIMGAIPPLTDADWQVAFEKYRQFPEYQMLNSSFTLEDFKGIYWWEYIHRALGRLVGVVFIVPFAWFLLKRWIPVRLVKRLLILFFLGGFQGFLGWFMVKSGLAENPHVSHYRLAAHLVTATVLLGYILWIIFSLSEVERPGKVTGKIRTAAWVLLGLVLIQITYGAFVAGLKAGYVFNTFPKMGDHWFPQAIISLEPIWKNFTQGLAGVQFVHRYLALIVLLVAAWLWSQRSKVGPDIGRKRAVNMIGATVLIQFGLGVLTLLFGVPVWIAVLHQAGAMLLFAAVVYLVSQLQMAEQA